MKVILDACAIIALVKNEVGADVVENYLSMDESVCMIHSVNLCEVYYGFLRSDGEEFSQKIIDGLQKANVVFRTDLDMDFWQRVGSYKASIKRISLADCFALALANQEKGILLTSDRKEFEPIVPLNICEIKFIR